jgi:hypothetical protein
MSLQTLITAHESATFDNAPSGFVLSTAAEGVGRTYEFAGEQPLTVTGAPVGDNRGGLKITGLQGVASAPLFDTAKKFAFEAKVAKADVASGVMFVGVSAAAATISATTPLVVADNDIVANSIGFYINSGDFDAVVPSSRAGSGSQVDKASVSISAGEYIRLGVKYDPNDRGIRYFVDGNEVASESTAVPASGTLLRAFVAGFTSTKVINCDYVAVAVKR